MYVCGVDSRNCVGLGYDKDRRSPVMLSGVLVQIVGDFYRLSFGVRLQPNLMRIGRSARGMENARTVR